MSHTASTRSPLELNKLSEIEHSQKPTWNTRYHLPLIATKVLEKQATSTVLEDSKDAKLVNVSFDSNLNFISSKRKRLALNLKTD